MYEERRTQQCGSIRQSLAFSVCLMKIRATYSEGIVLTWLSRKWQNYYTNLLLWPDWKMPSGTEREHTRKTVVHCVKLWTFWTALVHHTWWTSESSHVPDSSASWGTRPWHSSLCSSRSDPAQSSANPSSSSHASAATTRPHVSHPHIQTTGRTQTKVRV